MKQRFRGTVVVFTLTLFCSAALLFFVELMIGKMILPKFGGTPAVWNTCMVFFQSVLLAGYAYAHACTDKLTPRRQTQVQLVLLALPLILLMLPIRIDDSWAPKGEDYPAVGVLWLLMVAIGLPFFIISTSAPLLSKWFASTGDPAAKDPYFLYAASNVGSMVGLFAYPLAVEPLLGLKAQSWVWAGGYCALLGLTLWCARRVWQATPAALDLVPAGLTGKEMLEGDSEDEDADGGVAVKKKKRKRRKSDREAITRTPADQVTPPADDLSTAAPDLVAGTPPTLWRYLYWIALAFVPSSLMLAVTTYLTTDIASMPLLWVLPLGLYLLTFILVFSKFDRLLDALFAWFDLRDTGATRLLQPGFFGSYAWRVRRFGLHQVMILTMPVAVLLLVFLMVSGITVGSIWWAFLLHLTALFVVSMVCHGELARTRPATEYLTGFYLCLSFGGVIGGMFNALAAPLIFKSVAEYAIVLVIACLLLPPFDTGETETQISIPWFKRRIVFTVDMSKTNFWIDMGLAVALMLGAAYAIAKMISSGDTSALMEQAWFTRDVWRAIVSIVLAVIGMVYYGGRPSKSRIARVLDVALPMALLFLSIQLFLRSPFQHWRSSLTWMSSHLGIGVGRLLVVMTFGLPVALCYGFAERPVRFGLGVAAIFLAGAFTSGLPSERDLATHELYSFAGSVPEDLFPDHSIDVLLHQERSFFGVLKVEDQVAVKEVKRKIDGEVVSYLRLDGNFVRLLHGTTLHGEQRVNSKLLQIQAGLAAFTMPGPLEAATVAFTAEQELSDRRNEPLTYYHRTGPIGQVYGALCPRGTRCDVAFIGLGTGTMAGYVEPGQHADIYEIDSAVVRLASNPKYFTYLRDCRGNTENALGYDIKLGDARLKMKEASDGKYRLIVVDAFSSDAIPVHLITQEAVELYFQKLAPDGILAIHISNRHLELGPVLGNIAHKLGKVALREWDNDDEAFGKNTSDWVVMGKDRQALAPLLDREKTVVQVAVVNGFLGMFWPPMSLADPFANYYGWTDLQPDPNKALWTDDFSNILSVLRWR